HCIAWAPKETKDPEAVPLQLAGFASDGNIIRTYQGNPLQETELVTLDPELVAQYLGNEPIMQTYTPLGEIPTHCLNSILAIEDSRFLEHSGVSYTGILRALVKN